MTRAMTRDFASSRRRARACRRRARSSERARASAAAGRGRAAHVGGDGGTTRGKRGDASLSSPRRCVGIGIGAVLEPSCNGRTTSRINVSRQARKQLLVGSSTATCARARARSLSLRSPRRRQGPSLFLYCALTLPDNHTRRPQTPPPPAAHYHSSSRFRSFFLSSSLTLWLTGSLTQGGSGLYRNLPHRAVASDTQPRPNEQV